MDRLTFMLRLEENVPDIKGKEVWIWGTGNTARLYLEGIKRINLFEICGYCDNSSEYWGKSLYGKQVISPDELEKRSNIIVLICSPQKEVIQSVGQQLKKMGIEYYSIAEAVFKLYRREVMSCYDLLEDQFSKDTYAHIICCYLANEMPESCYVQTDEEYFWPKQFKMLRNETFIDCGAFTGDTIEKYIWAKNGCFKSILAFEPDRQNFKAMQYRMTRLKREWNLAEDSIKLFCCGVGAEKGVESFLTNGTVRSMCVSEGANETVENIDIISLDEFVKEPYDFIKVDIEGYEYKMLLGAQRGICKNKPIMAICIYHNAVDMFSLMLYIHKLVPEYKFSVRHYSEVLEDTILYVYL